MNNNIRLPIPKFCDACYSQNIKFTIRKNPSSTDKWPYCYFCYSCNASVGCHENTETPLGLMADGKTRRLRHDVHLSFDKLWKSELMDRDKAYFWMSTILKISIEECHISWLNKKQLLFVKLQCDEYFGTNFKTLIRRKNKNKVKENYDKESISKRVGATKELIKKRKKANSKKFKRKSKRF